MPVLTAAQAYTRLGVAARQLAIEVAAGLKTGSLLALALPASSEVGMPVCALGHLAVRAFGPASEMTHPIKHGRVAILHCLAKNALMSIEEKAKFQEFLGGYELENIIRANDRVPGISYDDPRDEALVQSLLIYSNYIGTLVDKVLSA